MKVSYRDNWKSHLKKKTIIRIHHKLQLWYILNIVPNEFFFFMMPIVTALLKIGKN